MSSLPRLHAPHESGAHLAVPPLAEVEQLLHDNQQRLQGNNTVVLGRSLTELRHQARGQALDAAQAYLHHSPLTTHHSPPDRLGEPGASATGVLVLAGHQSELFHPGVWLKNFALAGLARHFDTRALNLIVDSDIAKSTALRLPAWDLGADMGILDAEKSWPRLVHVPFDYWQGEIPYEERTVHDEGLFDSLPTRVERWSRKWGFVPLLPTFWAEAKNQAKRTNLLGERLAGARRAFERLWGCNNLEVPISELCRTEAFARFACHIVDDLPRFHEVFNSAIREYRRRRGIRSRNHPMPELTRDGDWLEAPLWAWKAGQARRARLFVQRHGSSQGSRVLHLRAGHEPWPDLNNNSPNGARLVHDWQQLARAGYKVRTRAVTTTLFARLFLADLFIHGLGGGLYDAVTDDVIRGFYGLEPPRFLILTGTLLLPFSPSSNPILRRRDFAFCLYPEANLKSFLTGFSIVSAS